MKIKTTTKSLTRHCASLSHPPKARSYPIPPSNLNLIPTVACSLFTQEGVGSKNSDCRVRHRATRVCCTMTTCPLRCPTQSLLAHSVRHYPVQRTEKTGTTYHLPVLRTYPLPVLRRPYPYPLYVPNPYVGTTST